MAQILSSAFTGSNGAAVAGWALQTGGTFQTVNNRGVLTPASAGYSPCIAVNTAAAVADSEVYITFTTNATIAESYTNVILRSPSPNTQYNATGVYIAFVPTDTSYQVNVADANGNVTNLKYVGMTYAPNTTYGVRLRVVGSGVQTKVWPLTQNEPDWQFSGTQTVVTAAGHLALETISGSAGVVPAIFDDLTLYDANRGVTGVLAGAMSNFFGPAHPAPPLPTAMPTGVVKSNGHTWTPVASEDFLTAAPLGTVRTKYPNMGYYNGFVDTSNQGTYDPDGTLSVASSLLTANLHTGIPSAAAQASGAPKTATPLVACVMPDNYRPTTYGRFSVRFRARETSVGTGTKKGYKFVWMYFPSDNAWNEGEIDAFETDIHAGKPGRPRPANAIPGSGRDANGQLSSSTGLPPATVQFAPGADYFVPTDTYDFHIATCEWTPEAIRIYWDGVLTTVIDNSTQTTIPTSVFNMKLQMETVISEGTVDPTNSATIDIDWIVLYSMTN